MQFIGREKELKILNELLEKQIARLVVIRGRRRIGKSRLAEQFGKNFPQVLSFIGLAPHKKITAQMQRDDFTNQMSALLNIAKVDSSDWGMLFRTLSTFVENKKVLLILDEISWMGGKDPTFLGKLKTAWDSFFKKNENLTLVLSGSVSSWIEKNILSSTGFVGRISLDLNLEPLPLSDCNLFWGDQKDHVSCYDKLKVLSVTGGIPRYLEEIVPSWSAEKNISRLCFSKGGLLYREFDHIFSDLFSKKAMTYRKIVHLLVNGPKSQLEISKLLKITKTGTLSEYLDDLVTAGFIERDFSWHIKTGKKSKFSRYRIKDNYTRFFLKVIEPNKAKIESQSFTFPSFWESTIALQFENLVLTNRVKLWELLNIHSSEIVFENPYFQKQTSSAKGCQIDYMIQNRYGSLYICEIKFKKGEVGLDVVSQIKEKVSRLQIPKYHSIRPVLIHVNGVKDTVLESGYFAHIVDFSKFL
ncbi:MAG: hypothetical protein K940chlam8_00893 [Chlamydiae bacterium]|nr:hypothetical protein [Chlamydiota bacterium]